MLFISASEKSSLSSNTIKKYSSVKSSISKAFRNTMTFYQHITPIRLSRMHNNQIHHQKKHVSFTNVDVLITDENVDNISTKSSKSNEIDYSFVVQHQRLENLCQKKTCLFLNMFLVCCLTGACIYWSSIWQHQFSGCNMRVLIDSCIFLYYIDK